MTRKQAKNVESDGEDSPELSPVDSEEDESVYDSEDGLGGGDQASDQDEDDFEDQGSSDDDDDRLEKQEKEDESDDDVALSYEKEPRSWKMPAVSSKRNRERVGKASASGSTATKETAAWMHTDDFSSDEDDPEGTGNRIGRVPLHWYDEYDHIGYSVDGKKIGKSATGDRLDQAIALQDNMAKGKFEVHDALNDRMVELTGRQLELIRRVQGGAFAHPEHDSTPDYIDYFSGVDPEISGIRSNQYEAKARFQPSKWEKLQVDRLLGKLNRGEIDLDYLKGKKKERQSNKPFLLWTGDEEDELSFRKGPQHIAAPKLPPPGHAESYVPPDEYLPTEEEKEKWAEMPPKDRPHGLLVPKKYPNLRSVGAYEHSVRETFERCLDLYLCPRVMKKRLNIDPESLVPRLPRASDLKPFPTAKCIEYKTPYEGDTVPTIRAVSPSPDGQFLASGASDGFVRLWQVETGRLLRSWDLSSLISSSQEGDDTKPVVDVKWNPNPSHHCMLAACGNAVVILATGTAGKQDAELTEALLSSAAEGGNVTNVKAQKTVEWKGMPKLKEKVLSASDTCIGPVCVIQTSREVANVRWHNKGDYFVSVSPKAGAAAVIIHQLSKGNSQQPFGKAKGEVQTACFHPNKPFLFVANQQHVRVYHLVKQSMVKRLSSGCRWISSIDVHPTGDHVIVGSLDRRMVWFDMDLGSTPYKTLKYHERALRSCQFHRRYPLMASASDDGAVHVFHSTVYSDLMRNPLVVPVKILRGHDTRNKLGVLTVAFHPSQPWIFTGGSDGKIFLFQDI